MFFFDFQNFENSKFRKYFGIFGVCVKEIAILNIRFGFCVFNSIREHRLKIFFDPQIEKIDPPKIDFFAEV